MRELGEREPGYTVHLLARDWEFRSPAGRWEMVVEVDHDSHVYFSKIWTDVTGPDFGYMLPSGREIHACPPRRDIGDVVVRVLDPGHVAGTGDRVGLVLATTTGRFPWSDYEDLPAQATYQGRGLGWELVYRPGGVGDMVYEQYPDKLHAKRRMYAIAKLYAAAYGLQVGPEMGRG